MTAYGYPKPLTTELAQQVKEIRERRKKVLDQVRARRREIYKKFLAKRQKQQLVKT